MNPPADLRERGLEFWAKVSEEAKLDSSGFVLLGEACRVIDRLDRLSDALNGAGRDWLKIADEVEEIGRGKIKVHVVVDGLLSEARQQQLAFKSLMAQMKLGNAEPKMDSQKKSALQQWMESRGTGTG